MLLKDLVELPNEVLLVDVIPKEELVSFTENKFDIRDKLYLEDILSYARFQESALILPIQV